MPETQEMVPYTYSFCRRCDRRVELGGNYVEPLLGRPRRMQEMFLPQSGR